MLADISTVDPKFFHSFWVTIASMLGSAGVAVGIYSQVTKRRRVIEPQPLEVKGATLYSTVDQCNARYAEASRRLDDHAHQITDLWNKTRDEHTAIRAEMNKSIQATERALGRIEGSLEELKKKQNQQEFRP